MAFYCWLAEIQHGDHLSAQEKVARYRDNQRCMYWVCVVGDFIVTTLAVLFLLALAALVALKAVWPPPFLEK